MQMGWRGDRKIDPDALNVASRLNPTRWYHRNVLGKGKTMPVTPYLFFNGRCEEAVEFYKKAWLQTSLRVSAGSASM